VNYGRSEFTWFLSWFMSERQTQKLGFLVHRPSRVSMLGSCQNVRLYSYIVVCLNRLDLFVYYRLKVNAFTFSQYFEERDVML
jgi:hypothetical protein